MLNINNVWRIILKLGDQVAIDKRIVKTRALIRKAFLELVQEQGFRKTTVKGICDRAFVGRKTFYSHYETIDFLVDEILEDHCILGKFAVAGTIYGLRAAHSNCKDSYYKAAYQFLEQLVHEIKKNSNVMRIFFDGKSPELEVMLRARSDKSLTEYVINSQVASAHLIELSCKLINGERFEEYKYLTLHPDMPDGEIIHFMLMSMNDYCHQVFEKCMDEKYKHLEI